MYTNANITLYNKYYETYRDGILYIGSHNIEDFNKAMIYWQEGKDDSAIYKLTKIIENGKYHPKYEEACWYLSLFYLKTKQNTEAIEMLEKIVTDNGYYADKATKIIEELENSIQ